MNIETSKLKSRILALVYLFSFIGTNAISAQSSYPLMRWDFNGIGGQSSAVASFVTGGLSLIAPSSVASWGSGVVITKWSTSNGLTGRGTVETLAQAISQNKYISFTLTPNSSQSLSVTSLKFMPFTQNRARKFALLSSIKGFAESNFIDTVTTKQGAMKTFQIPNHTNLIAPVEFRLYIYGMNEGWETYGLGGRPATETYDLSVEGYIPDNEFPSAPSGLSATNLSTSYFTLTWEPSTDNIGVSCYEVFKNGISLGTTTSTFFQIENLTKSTTYSLTVKAWDAFGNYSPASNPIDVTTSSTQVTKNNIGINISYAQDWSGDHAFADVMRLGRKWFKGSWGVTPAAVDSRGWPTEDACLCVWQGIPKMNGCYKLKFTGSATSITAGWAAVSITNKVYDPITNTTTANLEYKNTDKAGIVLGFNGTNGGVKDVQLMRPLEPGSTQSYPFGTTFTNQVKALLSKFSTIRFLDWELANGSPDSLWENRTPVDYFQGSLSRAAQPWETMIQLCNETQSDAWINIPVKATDDYIRQLALLWKERLNPNLKVYVEFSNELWNFSYGFFQFGTNINAAKAEVQSGNSSLNFDGEASEWYLGWRRVAKRIVEVSNVFREVWGDDAMMSRVRPVLMWQQGDGQSTASSQLLWLDHYSQMMNKPINYYLYGAGGSAYYGPNNNCDTLTIDNIWTNSTYNTVNWVKNNNTDLFLASAMGCKRLAYEGGPSMDNYGHSETVKAAAWVDPRMKDSMIQHHNFWSQHGGDLLMYYASTGSYAWGFSTDSYTLDSPKFQAIDELNQTDKYSVTAGMSAPFSVDGNNFDYANPGWSARSTGTLALRGIGRWGGYMFRSKAGVFNVSVQYAGATGSVVQFLLDGAVLGEETVNGAGTTLSHAMELSEGLHVIRICQKTTANIDIVKVDVREGVGKTTGIEVNNVLEKEVVAIYPNPATTVITIISSEEIYSVQFIGLDGCVAKSTDGGFSRTINISDLYSGLYIVRVQTNKGLVYSKLRVR